MKKIIFFILLLSGVYLHSTTGSINLIGIWRAENGMPIQLEFKNETEVMMTTFWGSVECIYEINKDKTSYTIWQLDKKKKKERATTFTIKDNKIILVITKKETVILKKHTN